jgi:hypothetical protein
MSLLIWYSLPLFFFLCDLSRCCVCLVSEKTEARKPSFFLESKRSTLYFLSGAIHACCLGFVSFHFSFSIFFFNFCFCEYVVSDHQGS